jgi:hypothetical protein
MKNKFAKNDLIFYFQFQEFPTSQISSCAMKHKELIFNDEAEESILSQINPKTKYSNCFVIDDEDSKQRTGGFKKNPITKGPPKQNPKPNVWIKNEPEENFDFFDDFKGKTDEKQVEKFKRNLEISFSKENSISITKSTFNDHLDPSYVPAEEVFSADNLFDNADKILGLTTTTLNIKKVDRPELKTDPNPKIVNMEFLFVVNESLNYPKDEQLWYIFHPAAKSAFGPLSSPNIKEMYDSKMLDGNSEIRFIDIYNYKNKKPFTFFSLKEIENTSFLENIEFSPLLKSDNSKGKQTEEKEKEKVKQETEKKSEVNVSTSKTETDDQGTKIITEPVHSIKTVQPVQPVQQVSSIQPVQPVKSPQPEKNLPTDQPKAQEDDCFFGFGGKKKTNKVIKPVEVDIKLGIIY